jgi:acetylglutamate kinase
MKKLHILKIGGNIIDDPTQLNTFIQHFSEINELKILIHGGGKLATELAHKLGIKQTLIEGRRITDSETLSITVMVYAGLINKTLVAKLQAHNNNAIGFCGADGNLIKSKKRENSEIDYGYVGDIVEQGIDVKQFEQLLETSKTPVISPITHDGKGNLLNTNADTMVSKIAIGLSSFYDVHLTYCFEKNGVLLDLENDESFIPILNKADYLNLKKEHTISKGMIPKLDNAFSAIENGVKRVTICHAKNISKQMENVRGTQLLKG